MVKRIAFPGGSTSKKRKGSPITYYHSKRNRSNKRRHHESIGNLPDAVDAPAKLRLLHGEKRDGMTEKKQEVPIFFYKKAKQKAKKKRGKKYTRKHAMVGKRQQRKRQMRSADILQASGRTSIS
jgi:hypothetical protein